MSKITSVMSKEIIAVDIDDVAADENGGIREFANRVYGFKHTPEDYLQEGVYKGYWEGVWKVNPEKAQEIYEAFVNSPDKANLKVIEEAIEGIDRLKGRYELVVITSREGVAMEVTKPWLERHFPDTFSRVEFVTAWSQSEKVSKAFIANALGVDYLIDDNATHCNLAAEAGIQTLLFGDYGWNRKMELHPSVKRVKNWQEILGYFNAK
jgi:5'(3')-deoxyribonucleotidase